MAGKRKHKRFTKRIEVLISDGDRSIRSFSSDLSRDGLFIRTNKGFDPGTILDIELRLPDHRIARVKGQVRRTIRTQVSAIKNGMGIRLLETDDVFSSFLRSEFEGNPDDAAERITPGPLNVDTGPSRKPENAPADAAESRMPVPDEFIIVSCISCGAKNKVPKTKAGLGPRCGRCREPLQL